MFVTFFKDIIWITKLIVIIIGILLLLAKSVILSFIFFFIANPSIVALYRVWTLYIVIFSTFNVEFSFLILIKFMHNTSSVMELWGTWGQGTRQ